MGYYWYNYHYDEGYVKAIKRRKKVRSAAGALAFVFFVLSFFLFVLFLALSETFSYSSFFDGGCLYGVSCSGEGIELKSETHEASVYGGADYNYYGPLPVSVHSRYELSNPSSLPVTAKLYFFRDASDESAPEYSGAAFNGEALGAAVYYRPYGGSFGDAEQVSSGACTIEGLPFSTPLTASEISPPALGRYKIYADVEIGDDGFVFYSGYTADGYNGGVLSLCSYVYSGDAERRIIYVSGDVKISYRAVINDKEIETELSESSRPSDVRGLLEEMLGEYDNGDGTYGAYNCPYETAFNILVKGFGDRLSDSGSGRFVNLGYLSLGGSQTYIVYTVTLAGGGTGVFEADVRLRSAFGLDDSDKLVYRLSYRASAGFEGTPSREILIKAEKFVADTKGASLTETLPPDSTEGTSADMFLWTAEPDWENLTVKNINGWGRYELTEEWATFKLYEEPIIVDSEDGAQASASLLIWFFLRITLCVGILSCVAYAKPGMFVKLPQPVVSLSSPQDGTKRDGEKR